MTGKRIRRLAIELFVVAAAGLVLGAFGPFGTFAMPLLPRLLYWAGFIVGGYAIFRPMLLAGDWLAEGFGLPRWLGSSLALSLGAVPVAVMVTVVMSGFEWSVALSSRDFPETYLQVLLIGVLINGLFHLLGRAAPPVTADELPILESAPQLGEPAFAKRLPAGFGPLLALAGEDHYVRAIAAQRDTLVLVRLRDAITELDGVDGMQVHRSWWVARDAVTGSKRQGRTLVLVLSNGREVPVARDTVPVLRQAGWLG